MNKPAPKEPSMDEILSSIRQIIADDDAGVTTRRPAFQAVAGDGPMTAKPAPLAAAEVVTPLKASAEPISFDIPEDDESEDDGEPFTLSAAQMLPVADDEPVAQEAVVDEDFSVEALLAEVGAESRAMPELVDPEDVAFEPEDVASEPELAEVEADEAFVSEAAEIPAFEPSIPSFVSEDSMQQAAPMFEAPAAAAPLPDPTLTSDLANQLLEPTTEAVVRSSFSRLNPLPLGAQGVTVESMMREMLRPMLKDWLDENLPTIVERMVEKEIARVSRGVE